MGLRIWKKDLHYWIGSVKRRMAALMEFSKKLSQANFPTRLKEKSAK